MVLSCFFPLDSGFWILDSGFVFPASLLSLLGFRFLDSGCLILDSGFLILSILCMLYILHLDYMSVWSWIWLCPGSDFGWPLPFAAKHQVPLLKLFCLSQGKYSHAVPQPKRDVSQGKKSPPRAEELAATTALPIIVAMI